MDHLLNEWNLDEIEKGLRTHANGSVECCICGCIFEPGEIFPIDGRYFDHIRAAQLHIQSHGGMFEQLIRLDKKYTGLTENQSQLMRMMRNGLTDTQIAAQLGVATSTVRHQRFVFREKARQAKAYLALFDLSVGSQTPHDDQLVPVHTGAVMVDDRYQITNAEEEHVRKAHFLSDHPLKLKSFPSKEKKKIIVLRCIIKEFEPEKNYTELEVNDVLRVIYDDFATIRRYLIEYGFMTRSPDGKEYRRSIGGISI